MQRNTEMLEKVMQHIDDHPNQHSQAVWILGAGKHGKWDCGTTACFAGWTALLTPGATWIFGDLFQYEEKDYDSENLAIKILGLTQEEAAIIFYSLEDRDELRLAVKDLINGDELRSVEEYEEETSDGE